MKTNMSTPHKNIQSSFLLSILTVLFFCISTGVKSQQGYNITGEIICTENGEAIAFANIALFDSTHTSIVTGAASNESGLFNMTNVAPGTYNLQVSALGFENYRKEISLYNSNLSMGVLRISGRNLELEDVNVISRRIPAKQAAGNTTFYISPRMQESSNTGTDILRLLPGVGIDLQQNISLEGSQNILILINGKERDASYLSQLPVSAIDKVEIISSPSARYDAEVTGVINVVLAEKKNSGWDGQLYAEIPISGSEVFLTPSYSLNYGFGKFNLSTSYNGDLRRFSLTESYRREVFNHPELTTVASTRQLTQKTWSHKFHYGTDWYINDRNQLNFYGFYNPYSQELDGTAVLEAEGTGTNLWEALKNDDDINHSLFNSLWYRHSFDKTSEHEITLEASRHSHEGINATTYTNPDASVYAESGMQPDNRSTHLRIDYKKPAGKSLTFSSGVQGRFRRLSDKSQADFSYSDDVYAAYSSINVNATRLEANVGLRLEHTSRKLYDTDPVNWWQLLPNVSVKHNLNPAHSLAINYRSSLSRPGFYQLNPYTSTDDPFTFSSGNPNLQPERTNQVYLEYSGRYSNHFLSTRLFFNHTSDVIRNLMDLDKDGYFTVQKSNLGAIHQYGFQLSGVLVFEKAGINPYIKLFDAWSVPNQLTTEHGITSRHNLVLESGLSGYLTIVKGLTASATFHYKSPMNEIRGKSFSDALYFVSLEKTLSKSLKAGIISGLPLARNFTYQGYEASTGNFDHYGTGELHLSALPLWIKISYSFASGRETRKIEREKSAPERELRKGF